MTTPTPSFEEVLSTELELFRKACIGRMANGHGFEVTKANLLEANSAAIEAARAEAVEAGLRHAIGAEIDPKWLRKAKAEVLAQLPKEAK